jgi:mannose-6-phosphate isomerase-like protein (cupin superfamily)
MRRTLALAMLCLPVAIVHGQTAGAPKTPKTPRNQSASYSDDQLRDIMQKAPAGFSTRLFADTTHSTALIRLVKSDTPHAHGTWSEVFVVREGSGVLETGGTITGVTGNDGATHRSMFVTVEGTDAARGPAATAGDKPAAPRKSSPGNLAGTDIEGGQRQAVKAGDVILIPAGVPHRWVQVDQSVVYLDIKFPKAE